MSMQQTVARLLNPLGVKTGQKIVATVTATSILDASAPTDIGVRVKADDSNTDSVYIGSASSVPTVGTGWRLKAGQEVELLVSEVNLIFAISASGSQKIDWVAF
jgi:hypothetical protein